MEGISCVRKINLIVVIRPLRKRSFRDAEMTDDTNDHWFSIYVFSIIKSKLALLKSHRWWYSGRDFVQYGKNGVQFKGKGRFPRTRESAFSFALTPFVSDTIFCTTTKFSCSLFVQENFFSICYQSLKEFFLSYRFSAPEIDIPF